MEAKICLSVFFFLLPIFFAREIENSMRNYQVLEVGDVRSFQNEEDFFSKLNLPLNEDLEFLSSDYTKGTAQVLVNPDLLQDFKTAVQDHGLSHKVIIEDVGQLIKNEKLIRNDMSELKGNATFERYMTYEEIQMFMKRTEEDFPERVSLKTIGESFEGEKITMITISDNTRRAKGKIRPIIFIEAGIHAREWISIASAVYLIETLVKTKSSLTEDVEWKIVPTLNPDGYKYSWTKHRFWRKNRRPHYYSHCFGVDLNRNFDSFWNKIGTSTLRCSSIYAGSAPFSEPETKAINDVFMDQDIRNRVKAYVSIHSYGQYILLPPGYNKIDLSTECSKILNYVAKKMTDAIVESAGPTYVSGTPAQVLYPASGGSMDWAMLSQNIPLAFTFEMRDKGKYGFLLPASQIKDTVMDIWVAVNELFKVITEKNTSQQQFVKNYRACELHQLSFRSSSNNYDKVTEEYNSETTEYPNELNGTESIQNRQNDIGTSTDLTSEYMEMFHDSDSQNGIDESTIPSTSDSQNGIDESTIPSTTPYN